MTKITQIDDRSAEIAWSPVTENADVIALGAKDSGGAGFEETGGELELYDMNLTNREPNQPNKATRLASIKTESRFASLAWSKGESSTSNDSNKFPLGLLAGGMENGTVNVWDPRAVIQQQQTTTIASFSQHQSGPVKALQFSSLLPSHLATGGSDGKVLITDLDRPDIAPFIPCANNTQQRAQITSIAWNTRVAHIVASAARDGTVGIWDIKSRKAWCELRAGDQAISDVAWNPTQGFHLLTASNDDRNPVIKLWDLRSSTSMPLATLTGHTQGVLSMSWCPHDEHLLLSCGKDNRTILWDLYAMSPIGDVPNDPVQSQQNSGGTNEQSMFGLASSQQRRYDVQWSPVRRGIVTTASLDRKVQAHSILGLAAAGRPPKWMRPSSSVSCAFGGAIVTCGATDKVVRIRTVAEDAGLEKLSSDFENSMDPNDIISFCHSRAMMAGVDANEKRLWRFMQVIFEANARQQLLYTLGFDPDIIAAKATAFEKETGITNGVGSVALDDGSHNDSGMSQPTQDIVKQALMVGNFEAAVDCCFRTGNLADALVLASCGGADLWAKTQERYFESQSPKRPFLSVVGAIIRNDLESFIQSSDLATWQETLAVLSTYGKSDEFPQLCVALGDRLEESGDQSSASLCYMCALSLNNAVKYWRTQLANSNTSKDGNMDIPAVHEFVVKVSTFLQAAGSTESLAPEDAEIFLKYAEKLAEQGLLVTAAKYCKGDSTNSMILRDRLYRSRASHRCLAAMGGMPPEFPFVMEDVKQNQGTGRTTQRSSERGYDRKNDYGAPANVNGNGNAAYSQTQQRTQQQAYSQPQQQAPAPAPTVSTTVPDGWMELQDPTSGRNYYANQTTGEVSWEKPLAAPEPSAAPVPVQPTPAKAASSNSRNVKLASKYGDGFVTSASHPELASQYGNVGTSNPYHTTGRPGKANVPSSTTERAPVSGNVDTIPVLKEEYQPIPDTLLSLINALKGGQLASVDKRQLAEAEKAVAIFSKRLALCEISDEIADKMLSLANFLSAYDWSSATAIQTSLVSNEWKENKEWLKGIRTLVQLATKMYSR